MMNSYNKKDMPKVYCQEHILIEEDRVVGVFPSAIQGGGLRKPTLAEVLKAAVHSFRMNSQSSLKARLRSSSMMVWHFFRNPSQGSSS